VAAAKLLLDRGAAVEAKKNDERTVLHEAVLSRAGTLPSANFEAVTLLLNKGVDAEANDANGETALDLAARAGYTEVVMAMVRESLRAPFSAHGPSSTNCQFCGSYRSAGPGWSSSNCW